MTAAARSAMPRGTMGNAEELAEGIAELEAALAGAGPEMRPILEQQIAAMRRAAGMVAAARPVAPARVPLAAEVAELFRPGPPPAIPTWIPLALHRTQVHEGLLRCPPGARIYFHEDAIACAVPGEPGVSLGGPHGITLRFFADGRLRAQLLYERGCVRWAIEVHPNGQAAYAGFYVGDEPHSYVEDGVHLRWDPSGVVRAETAFVRGARHGWSKLWEEDGAPISATLHDRGREVEVVLPDGTRRRS